MIYMSKTAYIPHTPAVTRDKWNEDTTTVLRSVCMYSNIILIVSSTTATTIAKVSVLLYYTATASACVVFTHN